jgi:DNA gyrase/topoisomerase IV subunit B
MQQNPQVMQMQQQQQMLNEAMESRKAQLVAETMDEYLNEEKKVLNTLGNDPLLQLKADELQLKAREEARKKEESEDKLAMENLKLLQAKEIAEDKLQQDDEHAKLRASVSLAKDGIKNMQATIKEVN